MAENSLQMKNADGKFFTTVNRCRKNLRYACDIVLFTTNMYYWAVLTSHILAGLILSTGIHHLPAAKGVSHFLTMHCFNFLFSTRSDYGEGEEKERFNYFFCLVFVQCIINAICAKAGETKSSLFDWIEFNIFIILLKSFM